MAGRSIAIVAIGAGLLVALALYAGYIARSDTISSSSIHTSTISASSEVVARVNSFVENLDSRNVSTILKFYTNESLVKWKGNTTGLAGTYSMADGGIRLLYKTVVRNTVSLHATVSNLSTRIVGPDAVNATFEVLLKAKSAILGNMNATIAIQQQWVEVGGSWMIQKDNWDFLSLVVEGQATAPTTSAASFIPVLGPGWVIGEDYAPAVRSPFRRPS